MEDLYLAVGVSRTASKGDIEAAIKQKFRIWNKRVNSSDLSRRQEAETRLARLEEARRILLDKAKRAAYDRDLAASPPAAAPQPTGAEGGNWLERATTYLGRNDYHSAAYAAREARKEVGDIGEVWATLARANYGLNRLDEALYEAKEAARLEQDRSERHFLVADVLESMGNWSEAIGIYEQVRVMPGAANEADMGIANAYISTDRFQEAIKLLDRLRDSATGGFKTVVGRYLAIALIFRAEQVPKVRTITGYLITTAEEMAAMRPMLAKVTKVTEDAELIAEARRKQKYLDSCEVETYWPDFPVSEVLKASVAGLALTITSFACAGTVSGGWALFGVLVIAVSIGYIMWVIGDRRKFQWEVNAEVAKLHKYGVLDPTVTGIVSTGSGVY
jgi:tetratricopeptide (TPR) repeat protein